MRLCGIAWLAALGMAAWPISVGAQPEPIVRQPYEVHVVILLADHRFLTTELFQERFSRDLVQRASLSLGPLARVDAATSHPLAEAIRRDGIDAVLDAHEEVSQRRTWFFVVEFRDGQFHLQGRFFDGLTGLPGPPARTLATSDRGRLAPLAARMIVEPFPLVGMVTSVKGENVDLALYGMQLSDKAELPRGAIFAISRIAPQSGKLRARRVPWAVLEAKGAPASGVVGCRFWHRFRENALTPADGVVFRALVLPTRTAHLTLQVIDRETSRPLAGVGVSIDGGVPRTLELVTDSAGSASTTAKVAGFALVKLTQGGVTLAQLPMPIVDDRPVVCVVSARPDAESRAGLDVRRYLLVARILGTLQVVEQRFGEQRVLLGQSLERSLEHAKKTLDLLEREIAEIRAERAEIVSLAAKSPPAKETGDEGVKGLARLTQLRDVVRESVGRMTQAIVDRDAQSEKQKMAVKFLEQASLLESQAQFDEAIEVYQKAVALLPEPGKIADRLKTLRAAWEIKSETHKQARKYLIEIWPKVEVAFLKEHLPGAEQAIEDCLAVNDRLTPRRFLAANVDHLTNIGKIIDQLKRSRTTDDQQQLREWRNAIDTLRRLSNRASEPAIAETK